MILGGWIVLSPGVFTIPPTEGWLDGVTIIYVDKPSNVPFFSSPAKPKASETESEDTVVAEKKATPAPKAKAKTKAKASTESAPATDVSQEQMAHLQALASETGEGVPDREIPMADDE